MSNFFNYINSGISASWSSITKLVQTADRTDWYVAGIVVLVIGVICMRGFKARL